MSKNKITIHEYRKRQEEYNKSVIYEENIFNMLSLWSDINEEPDTIIESAQCERIKELSVDLNSIEDIPTVDIVPSKIIENQSSSSISSQLELTEPSTSDWWHEKLIDVDKPSTNTARTLRNHQLEVWQTSNKETICQHLTTESTATAAANITPSTSTKEPPIDDNADKKKRKGKGCRQRQLMKRREIRRKQKTYDGSYL